MASVTEGSVRRETQTALVLMTVGGLDQCREPR